MSHVATVKTAIKNLTILVKTCNALGIPFTQGQQSVGLYEREVAGDFSCKLPGWYYPVVVDSQTGEISFDNYKGSWGDEKELHKLIQEYSLEVAEEEASEFVLQGYTIEREKQENGDIQLVISQGM